MKDRVPEYPGRVRLMPVTGQTNIYDMTLADSPIEAGTPLNKRTLLTDETAAIYGLDDTAVPDDVFAALPGVISDAGPQIGDVLTTYRTDLGDSWVLCNGAPFSETEYPNAQPVIDPNYARWPVNTLKNYRVSTGSEPTYASRYDNGYYYGSSVSGTGFIAYSADGESWNTQALSINSLRGINLIYHKKTNKWVLIYATYFSGTGRIMCQTSDDITSGTWSSSVVIYSTSSALNLLFLEEVNEVLILAYQIGTTAPASIFFTEDDSAWTAGGAIPRGSNSTGIVYYKGTYYVASASSESTSVTIYSSSDLSTYTSVLTLTTSDSVSSLSKPFLYEFEGKLYLSYGQIARCYQDETFTTYTDVDTGTARTVGYLQVAKEGDVYVKMCAGNTVATSSPSYSWVWTGSSLEDMTCIVENGALLISENSTISGLLGKFLPTTPLQTLGENGRHRTFLPCFPTLTEGDGAYVYIKAK